MRRTGSLKTRVQSVKPTLGDERPSTSSRSAGPAPRTADESCTDIVPQRAASPVDGSQCRFGECGQMQRVAAVQLVIALNPLTARRAMVKWPEFLAQRILMPLYSF